LRAALAEGDKLGPEGFPAQGRDLSMLAEIMILEGDFSGAHEIAKGGLERGGADSPLRLYFLAHLAESERHLGDLDASMTHYREAIALAENNASLVASGTFAAIIGNSAAVALDAGRSDEANALQQRDVALMEQVFGKDSV